MLSGTTSSPHAGGAARDFAALPDDDGNGLLPSIETRYRRGEDVGKPSRATFRLVDRPSPEQIARYRAMTPGERLRQSTRLYWSARRLREAHERTIHPDWSDDQVHDHVRKIFLLAGT